MELTSPGLIWLIVGVGLFLLEMALPGFILFFFGAGAWVTSIFCWFFPLSLNNQLLIFLLSSLLFLFGLRGFIKRTFFGSSVQGEDQFPAHEGERGVVIAAILPPAEGKIKYSGTQWRALAEERIEEGESVVIVSRQGLVVKVRKQ